MHQYTALNFLTTIYYIQKHDISKSSTNPHESVLTILQILSKKPPRSALN